VPRSREKREGKNWVKRDAVRKEKESRWAGSRGMRAVRMKKRVVSGTEERGRNVVGCKNKGKEAKGGQEYRNLRGRSMGCKKIRRGGGSKR